MAEVSEKLEPVKELFGIEEPPLVRGVIVNNRLEAARSFPPVSRAAGRGHLYSGFAFSDYGVFALVGLNSDGIVHEATHLLLREAVDTPVAKIPSWLNEGLAMYFEQGSVGRQRVVEDALRRGSLMRLRNMNTVPGRPARRPGVLRSVQERGQLHDGPPGPGQNGGPARRPQRG